MLWKSQYVISLESRISELTAKVADLEKYNQLLVERLLLKNNVPLAAKGFDMAEAEQLVNTADIFGDDEEEIVDNRKGDVDAFVG